MELLKKEHVCAGSYQVRKKRAVLLQAFLGTCVGVALYDKVKRTGGMIHIPLPEPPSTSPPEYPEKYASTGLPILLDELFTLGADRANLTATIAGGALMPPLSKLDIDLTELEVEKMDSANLLPTLKRLGFKFSDLPAVIDSIPLAILDSKGRFSPKPRKAQ